MTRFHNYYILKPSFVPVSLAVVILCIALNFVLFVNGMNECNGSFCLRPDVFYYLLLVVVVCNWLFLNMSESTGRFSSEVTGGILAGFSLFILSEVMLFFSFFWAFFYFSLTPSIVLGSIWPPLGLQDSVVPTLNIPLANTVVLLSSGVSLTLAQYASRLNNSEVAGYRWCLVGMGITILYALYFVVLQALEYTSAAIDISTSIYGSVFYMLTGLHGSHVIIGTLALIICTYQLYYRNIGSDLSSTFFTCTIWYWHFVDIVWIFVFSLVYAWGNLLILPVLKVAECDFAESAMLTFQDPATYAMQTIIALHNYIMFYLILILVFVLVLLFGALTTMNRNLFTYKYKNNFKFRFVPRRGSHAVHRWGTRFLNFFEFINRKISGRRNSILSFVVWFIYVLYFLTLQSSHFYFVFGNFIHRTISKLYFCVLALLFNYFRWVIINSAEFYREVKIYFFFPYKVIFFDWLRIERFNEIFNGLLADAAALPERVFFAQFHRNFISWVRSRETKRSLNITPGISNIRSTWWGVFFFAYFDYSYKYGLGLRGRNWKINRVDRCFQAVTKAFPRKYWKKVNRLSRFANYYKARSYKKFTHYAGLEWAWSVLPVVILGFIAVPSIIALYGLDDANAYQDCFVVKVIGHQWYWEYEISFLENGQSVTYAFDSYMLPTDLLPVDGLRLLEVDYPLYLPVGVPIKLLVTSTDVIHSWTVPSFGVKVDAVPGRLNQIVFLISREGDFYGQCSELCGVKHGFMPIHVVAFSATHTSF